MPRINTIIRPFLKWAGGKRQLVPEITAHHLPKKFNVYYEPFIGGGALFFSLQHKKAVINDINYDLINCYRIIKDSLDELIDDLKSHENDEDYYYAIRDWDREKSYKFKALVQRVSRIIFLNKTCYNGLFRVNSQGQFNVPFGKYKNPNILDIAVLKAVKNYLSSPDIKILNCDFENAVKNARKGDLVYFDPPYDPVSDTSSFTGYDVNKFNKDEQGRLKKIVDELNSRGCYVLLSNACTLFITDLSCDYQQTKISAIRAINSKAEKRGKVDEILIKNYEPFIRKS